MFDQSDELLISMALRADHGFGLDSDEQKARAIDNMKELYRYYAQGLSDEEIAQKTVYGVVTVGQVREEVNGTGFFSPQKQDFYKSFK